MKPSFWAEVHGASTHFPVALALCSAGCDALAAVFVRRPAARELRGAGYWCMLGAAAGSVPAVISGLMMTRGVLWGQGDLRRHHLFAWPAFALVVGLATWRLLQGPTGSPRGAAAYGVIAGGTAALMAIAAFWGGALLLAP